MNELYDVDSAHQVVKIANHPDNRKEVIVNVMADGKIEPPTRIGLNQSF